MNKILLQLDTQECFCFKCKYRNGNHCNIFNKELLQLLSIDNPNWHLYDYQNDQYWRLQQCIEIDMNNNLYDGYNKSRKICCKIEHEISNLHGYSHNYYRYIKIELPSVLEFLDQRILLHYIEEFKTSLSNKIYGKYIQEQIIFKNNNVTPKI